MGDNPLKVSHNSGTLAFREFLHGLKGYHTGYGGLSFWATWLARFPVSYSWEAALPGNPEIEATRRGWIWNFNSCRELEPRQLGAYPDQWTMRDHKGLLEGAMRGLLVTIPGSPAIDPAAPNKD